MNFGMFTDFHIREHLSQEEAFDESFRQAEEAERLGMDSIWLAEHHFSPDRSVLASPIVIASSLATRTRKIRIGLAVQVLPLTNPLRIAEEAATVDHISKRRFDLRGRPQRPDRVLQGIKFPLGGEPQPFSRSAKDYYQGVAPGAFSPPRHILSLPGRARGPQPLPAPPPAYSCSLSES